ncbi:hypothetical protein ACC846_37645, partial [Rhizobium ruizarguesonis]
SEAGQRQRLGAGGLIVCPLGGDINEREGITVITNLHTLDTARNYCERIVGMAGGRVVFDGKPSEMTAEAVKEIYGTDKDGAGIDETVTSTSINIA